MKGKVYLVGAGPGDPKLMTLKGMEAVKDADVIVYDRLANEIILKEAREDCEFIYVGKTSNNHTMNQDDINKLIGDKALEGKIVTRLKGGDPYVFGRGGEEGEELYSRGIDFEVIPGITSSIGGLAYGGIPITHRDYSSSFHVFTGHFKDDDKEYNWDVLAKLKGTMVFLMGMKNLEKITTNLINYGKRKDTPVAIINWATRYNQKTVTGNLENIVDVVKREDIKPPSLIVIGEVVKLRDKLNFFEKKPLFGKNIVVTRSRTQSSTLVEKIINLGGNPIEFPTIKIEEIIPNESLDLSIKNINEYSYLIFTSVNGVKIFFNKLFDLGYDSRVIGRAKVIAIGSATSSVLEDYGIRADIIPKNYVAEDIYNTLKDILKKDDNILIPRSREARSYLVDKLSDICSVDEVITYNTLLEDINRGEILEFIYSNSIDYITFTSSSTVKNFLSIIGEDNIDKLENIKLISIGPITSSTIESYGLKVYDEAKEYTIDGVIKCISKR